MYLRTEIVCESELEKIVFEWVCVRVRLGECVNVWTVVWACMCKWECGWEREWEIERERKEEKTSPSSCCIHSNMRSMLKLKNSVKMKPVLTPTPTSSWLKIDCFTDRPVFCFFFSFQLFLDKLVNPLFELGWGWCWKSCMQPVGPIETSEDWTPWGSWEQ